MSASLLYNGKVIPKEKVSLPTHNRAFTYGDGFFETILVKNGKPLYLEEHYRRLRSALEYMDCAKGLPPLSSIENSIEQVLSENELANEDSIIKINAWRTAGGLYEPLADSCEYLIQTRDYIPEQHIQQLKHIGFYSDFPKPYSPISSFKSIAVPAYIAAGIYKKKQQLEEVVLMSPSQTIAETLYANLFWLKNEQLYTPSLSTGCINGIMRQQLLKRYHVVEVEAKPEELSQATLVFTINSAKITQLVFSPAQSNEKANQFLEKLKQELY